MKPSFRVYQTKKACVALLSTTCFASLTRFVLRLRVTLDRGQLNTAVNLRLLYFILGAFGHSKNLITVSFGCCLLSNPACVEASWLERQRQLVQQLFDNLLLKTFERDLNCSFIITSYHVCVCNFPVVWAETQENTSAAVMWCRCFIKYGCLSCRLGVFWNEFFTADLYEVSLKTILDPLQQIKSIMIVIFKYWWLKCGYICRKYNRELTQIRLSIFMNKWSLLGAIQSVHQPSRKLQSDDGNGPPVQTDITRI